MTAAWSPAVGWHDQVPEVLVAIDWEGENRSIEPVLALLEQSGALLDVTVATVDLGCPPKPRTEYRVTFDRAAIRPAHVHERGYRAGFIVHLEA